MKPKKAIKVAIVHDWLIGGGAEKVVEQLHKIYPQAPIYTSYCSDEWRQKLNGKVITGYLQNWPFSKIRKFIPFLRGWWFSRLNLNEYDLVISSAGAEAKFVKVKSEATHISYIHAPTHYYWNRYDDYLAHPGIGILDPLARWGLKILVGPMRKWDFRAAQRPDYLIANSNFTKSEIKKYYKRDSAVIHPPVDTKRFDIKKTKNAKVDHGFLIVGRQTPYKCFDIAVEACTELNLPLTVIGKGPENRSLRKMAGPTINFIESNDHDLPRYFSNAKAFIFPGLDDFGIVAVEALASGTPVIAYKGGGALDYIKPSKTGEFFNEQSSESLIKVLQKFDPSKFNVTDIKNEASGFSETEFQSKISAFIKHKF